jgi:hypothetical protein
LLRDHLSAAYSHALQLAYPTGPFGREDNGFTEFRDDNQMGRVLPIYRRYCVSVSRALSETSDRRPFLLRRIELFSPVVSYDSYGWYSRGESDGRRVAYAADTGSSLWSFDAQVGIVGAPVASAVDGRNMFQWWRDMADLERCSAPNQRRLSATHAVSRVAF